MSELNEPSPAQREQEEREHRAKEAAEQAMLPYQWTQTIKDADVTILIDAKYKGKDLDIKLTRTTIKAAIKGQEPFIDVSDLEEALVKNQAFGSVLQFD